MRRRIPGTLPSPPFICSVPLSLDNNARSQLRACRILGIPTSSKDSSSVLPVTVFTTPFHLTLVPQLIFFQDIGRPRTVHHKIITIRLLNCGSSGLAQHAHGPSAWACTGASLSSNMLCADLLCCAPIAQATSAAEMDVFVPEEVVWYNLSRTPMKWKTSLHHHVEELYVFTHCLPQEPTLCVARFSFGRGPHIGCQLRDHHVAQPLDDCVPAFVGGYDLF